MLALLSPSSFPHYLLWQESSWTVLFFLFYLRIPLSPSINTPTLTPTHTHTFFPPHSSSEAQSFLQTTAPEVNWKGSCSQTPSSWWCFAPPHAGLVSRGLEGSVLFYSNLDKVCSLSALSAAAWHSVYFCKTQSWIDFNKYRVQRLREPSELITTWNLADAPAQTSDWMFN